MTQTKQDNTTTIDQRIFSLFNSCQHNEDSFEGSFAFSTATPAASLHLFKILKTQVSQQEFDIHQPTYVRGMTIAINKNEWPQSNAQDLIDITNWFIDKCKRLVPHTSKKKTVTQYFRSPRKAQIQQLVNVVSSKVNVPQEQKDKWNALLAPARVTVPKDCGLLPETCYQTSFSDLGKVHVHGSFDR